MKKWLKITLITLGAGVVGLVLVMFRPDTYLPHKRIVIAVPFSAENPPMSLIPMGETIEHPKPQTPKGHPGIDFAWAPGVAGKVTSSSDGKVSSIELGTSHKDLYDVTVSSGPYLLRYKELKDYNRELKKGTKVKTGDYIGIPGTLAGGFHWELASKSLARDRFCPMTYFDPGSKQLIEKIWDQTPVDAMKGMKRQFPHICSGDYFDVEE